jgi:hypothetical protein
MQSTTPRGSTFIATTYANGSSTPTSAPPWSATISPNNIGCKAFSPGSWVTRIRGSGRLCCQLIVSEMTRISQPTSRQQITEPQNELWSQGGRSAMKMSFIRMWVGSLIAVLLCVATGAAQTVTGQSPVR